MSRGQMRICFGYERDDPGDVDIIDDEPLPTALGHHQLFDLIVTTPRGTRRIQVTSEVTKH